MQDPIVITGIGIVSPLGHSPDEVVENLRAGRSALRGLPEIRLENVQYGTVEGLNSDDVFNFLPNESALLTRMDLGLVFGQIAARRALVSAGIAPNAPELSEAAVVVSSSKGQINSLLASWRQHRQRIHSDQGDRIMAIQFQNFFGDTCGTLIAIEFGCGGPVLNYPAACATGAFSLVPCVHLLNDGDASIALAGSTESTRSELTLGGFRNMGVLASGNCRPFDARRNGFSPGEGAAVFVLEREADAKARGAQILARLCGWDLRGDGHHATAADPQGAVLEHTIRRALARAGWQPSDVDYINAHGTGTIINDAVEAGVLLRIFGDDSPPISSLKSHMGHLLGASSSVELAASIACLREGWIPPTLRLEQVDPAFRVRFVARGGESAPKAQRLLKLSLGFGGHLSALCVEVVR